MGDSIEKASFFMLNPAAVGEVTEIMASLAGGNRSRLLSVILYAGCDAEQVAQELVSVVESCQSNCAHLLGMIG